MAITVIFLVSCIITARLLDKKKLRVASGIYGVLFVILLLALLFTTHAKPISYALSNLLGLETYLVIKDVLVFALHSAGYGTCITVALLVTLILQILLSVLYAVVTIARLFKKGKEAQISKKDKYRCPDLLRALYLNKRINLLYCRMLN